LNVGKFRVSATRIASFVKFWVKTIRMNYMHVKADLSKVSNPCNLNEKPIA